MDEPRTLRQVELLVSDTLWLPMAALFEIPLALWLLFKGVGMSRGQTRD